MALWDTVAAVAARQFGLIARWQLRLMGLSKQAIQSRLDGHGWRVLFPGVYALPGVPASPWRRASAALLAYSQPGKARDRVEALRRSGSSPVDALVGAAFGPWAVLTGPTAAHLRGLAAKEPARVHVALACGGSRIRQADVALTFAPVPDGERTDVHGIPVAVVERALADIAALADGRADQAALARLIATADAKRLTSPDGLARWSAARGPFKGKRLLDRTLADLGGELSHSGTERRGRRMVARVAARYGLTVAPRPYPIQLDGRTVAEADVAVLEIAYDIEIDGPHHLLPTQVTKDKQRDRRAGQAGWTVDRFSVEEIDRSPEAFMAAVDARLRQLLAQKCG